MIIWLGEVFKDAREYTHWYGVHSESRVVEVVVHPYARPSSVRPLIVSARYKVRPYTVIGHLT